MLSMSQLHGFNAGGEHDPYDPYWGDVVLLMHMNGANGSTSFMDEKGHTIAAYGGAAISTAQSKFGGTSAVFDGDADYLSSSSSDYDISTDALTVEAWVYSESTSNQAIFGALSEINAYSSWAFYISPTNGMTFDSIDTSGTYQVIGSGAGTGTSLTTNAWHHIAMSMESDGDIRFFVDGNQIGSTGMRSWSIRSAAQGYTIGGLSHPINHLYFDGYIDELRITKGIARYTSNFTPPTAPFPNS